MFLPLAVQVVAVVVGANPHLDEGRKLFRGLYYQEAEVPLRRACRVPTSTPQETLEAFDLLARTLAAQGRLDEAEGWVDVELVDPWAQVESLVLLEAAQSGSFSERLMPLKGSRGRPK